MHVLLKLIFLILSIIVSGEAFAQAGGGSVEFRISEVSKKAVGDSQDIVWLASHDSVKGKAQFLITMQLKQPSGSSPFSFSKGSFERVQGSRPSEFLKQLSAALAAQKPRLSKSKLKKLPFDMAILGTGLSRAGGSGQLSGGAFAAKPSGSWIATKIFLAGGEAEVFLNLDPVSGIGEFSIKDEEYGDTIVQELSRVL